MICRFNNKLICCEILHDCNSCLYSRQLRLDENTTDKRKENFVCPYCLYKDTIEGFETKNRYGIVLKIKKCSRCGNYLHIFTLELVRKFSIKDLVKWIWLYPSRDYWRKVNYELLGENINKLNMIKIVKGESIFVNKFWEEYFRIKESGIINEE